MIPALAVNVMHFVSMDALLFGITTAFVCTLIASPGSASILAVIPYRGTCSCLLTEVMIFEVISQFGIVSSVGMSAWPVSYVLYGDAYMTTFLAKPRDCHCLRGSNNSEMEMDGLAAKWDGAVLPLDGEGRFLCEHLRLLDTSHFGLHAGSRSEHLSSLTSSPMTHPGEHSVRAVRAVPAVRLFLCSSAVPLLFLCTPPLTPPRRFPPPKADEPPLKRKRGRPPSAATAAKRAAKELKAKEREEVRQREKVRMLEERERKGLSSKGKAATTTKGSLMPLSDDNSAAAVPSISTGNKKDAALSDDSDTTSALKDNANTDIVGMDGGDKDKVVRRVTHNVIEKRYRNNLNQRILDLKMSVPSLNMGVDGIKQTALSGLAAGDLDDDEDGGTGGGAGGSSGRLNKGTILKKATEYIKELEDQRNRATSQLDQFKDLVSTKLGPAGQALVADFFSSSFSATPSVSPNLHSSATIAPKRPSPTPPTFPPTLSLTKASPAEAASVAAQAAATGLALIHQQQQQIQQWLQIQQQYQVAAAVAAAASVEAFKSISAATATSPSPLLDDLAPLTAGTTSPGGRSVPDGGAVSVGTSLSPDGAFGMSPRSFGLFDAFASGAAALAGVEFSGLLEGAEGDDMLLDASPDTITAATAASGGAGMEEESADHLFDYLVGFGDEMMQAPVEGGMQGGDGLRMLAMMFMSASVLYSPAPFEHGSEGPLHEHVLGKMMRRGADAAPLKVAGFHFQGWMGLGVAGAWWLLKVALILFGLSQAFLALRGLFTRRPASKHLRRTGASADPVPLSQLRALTATTLFPTSLSSRASVFSIATEVSRFLLCNVVGFGCVVDSLLTIGKRSKTCAWHAVVAKTAGRVLDAAVESAHPPPIQILKVALLAQSHAAMATSHLTPLDASMLKMTSALALRSSIHDAKETLMAYAISSLASWLWSDGLSSAQEILRDMEAPPPASVPRWIAETTSGQGGHWSTDHATDLFESDVWIPVPRGSYSALHAFSANQSQAHLLHDFAAASNILLASPSTLTPPPNPREGLACTSRFIAHLHDAQLSASPGADFAAASLAILACWRARVPVPAFVQEAWTRAVGAEEGDVCRRMAAVGLVVLSALRTGQMAGEALDALEALVGLREARNGGVSRISAAVEFAVLSWVLEALEGRGDRLGLKVVARMRVLLPSVVVKEAGLVAPGRSNEHVKCVMGWMNSVRGI
ncbi:hypothetical protein BC830DRAFT_1171381 [Chytriomyces sp. MP71]|nr:hypothetical protein BC830DRAFT_1171381 [Chytriomyces sp. MP71]